MNLRLTVRRYFRFIVVAAVLALVSMVVLEMIGWLFPYKDPVVHGAIVTLVYLAGVFVNYHLQRLWVFQIRARPGFVRYALWMITSAMIVGLVAGLVFDVLMDRVPTLPLLSSISLAVALALVSPLTFSGVALIMRGKV
ncbi:MAG: hypothetical protein ACFHX7_20985 [Pseudomonadota bacterium]